MPNLIHFIDATSINLLYEQFIKSFDNKDLTQFYSVHDCFATTCDKVFLLKTILAFVYTDLYSSDPYLYKFDKSILDSIENNTHNILDREKRTLKLTKLYTIHDMDWILNKKILSTINKIDSQYIII